MKYRRIMLGIVMLSTMVLLYRVSQLPPRSLARKAGSLSTASRERAIRAYYSARQPDWRNRPPLLVQKTHRHSHSRKVAIVPEKWYGSSRQVGPSPYDYTPRALQQDERKTRLLFLVEFRDYLERMNSHTYELIDAALAHPRVEVDVWGAGWAGWDSKLKLSENLAQRVLPGTLNPVGCGYYDAYWTISDWPNRKQEWVDNAGCGTVHYHQYGDCHSDECMQDIFVDQGNITTTKYAFELLDLVPYERLEATYPNFKMQLLTHSPDAANPWDYYPLAKWSDKCHGAVLFGAAHELYTIRPTVATAISNKKTFITRFSHPGFEVHRYRVSDKLGKLATYTPGHPSYRTQRQKREEFAQGMREAQICVFDSSMEKKAIRKYAQAFLSGCVVAADLPTEQEGAFRDFMIVLRPQASIEEINAILYEALQDPIELQRKAMAAFAYAREGLTNTRKVDRMLSDVQAYRRGDRGYSFAHPFSLTCRKYWKFSVPWCGGSRQYLPKYAKTM